MWLSAGGRKVCAAEAARGYLRAQALPKGCSSAEAADGYPLAWGAMRPCVLGEGVWMASSAVCASMCASAMLANR